MEYLDFKNLICEQMNRFVGIVLSDEQCHNFFIYMNLLIEKNKVMNLTTITEPKEIILRHFVDSSIPIKFYNDKIRGDKYICDIGTGAGFPGLPLAILCPESKFVLNDTLGKRINFLSEVVEAINIKNVKLIKARAEDFGHDKCFREKFDYVLSRGVSRISVLSEYSLPLVNINGIMLAYKMNNCDDELNDGKNAIETLGGMFHVKHKYSIVDDEPERCLIEIFKNKCTPNMYPRKAGTPANSPL